MRIEKIIRYRWIALAIAVLALWAFQGCGSAKQESSGGDGSSSSTVSGSTSSGGIATINVTTNRNSIKVGDTALVEIIVTCSKETAQICIKNSSGTIVFYAQPTEFQTADFSAEQRALDIPISYSTSKEFVVGDSSGATAQGGTSTITLSAGTRSSSTASVGPGQTLQKAVFSLHIRGNSVGSGIFTVQSFDAIASLTIDVFKAATSAITGT